MQSDQFVTVDKLAEAIHRCYQRRQTGTIYFVSLDNLVGFINLENGQIVALQYSSQKNEDALESIKNLQKVSYRFNESKLDTDQKVQLSTPEILDELGLKVSVAEDTISLLKSRDNIFLDTENLIIIIEQILDDITASKKLIFPSQIVESYGAISSFSQLSRLLSQIEGSIIAGNQSQFRRLVEQRIIHRPQVALGIIKEVYQETIGPISELVYDAVLSEFKSVDNFSQLFNFISQLAGELESSQYKQQFYASLRDGLGKKLPIEI